MIETIYLEAGVKKHPRVAEILARFPGATVIPIEQYSEVFNVKSQNFRLQKKRPSLILAHKQKGYVLPAPEEYTVGTGGNYYFSHMLNCLYDCRYCFLQGMYRSAHYLLFVNYEDFGAEIDSVSATSPGQSNWFYSGYDCDSLALDPVTGFVDWSLDFFQDRPGQWLELRSKSTQIRALLKRQALPNCVVAFSLAPDSIVNALEHKAPSLARRFEAMRQLQQAGWQVGIRLDPLIYQDNYQAEYSKLIAQIGQSLDVAKIHSVSLGVFRLPKGYFRSVQKLYPDEVLFSANFSTEDGMVSYDQELQQEMTDYCSRRLLEIIPEEVFFPCYR